MYLSPLVLDYIIIKPVIRSNYQYKYNGKEYQDELGLNLYDMDFRDYDPAIGRWTGIDPVVHYSQSTYNAFDGNPVFWADPSGADSQTIYDFDGNGYSVGDNDLMTVWKAGDINASPLEDVLGRYGFFGVYVFKLNWTFSKRVFS